MNLKIKIFFPQSHAWVWSSFHQEVLLSPLGMSFHGIRNSKGLETILLGNRSASSCFFGVLWGFLEYFLSPKSDSAEVGMNRKWAMLSELEGTVRAEGLNGLPLPGKSRPLRNRKLGVRSPCSKPAKWSQISHLISTWPFKSIKTTKKVKIPFLSRHSHVSSPRELYLVCS